MSTSSMAETDDVSVKRLGKGPIIHAGLHPSIGDNIQGPSLIRVPDWVADPLGKYYLYFADHKGAYIRLAYADHLTGPWQIHAPGSLQLSESHFLTNPPEVSADQARKIREAFAAGGIRVLHDPVEEVTAPHIASPDVHVDHARQRIVMYFHGLEDVGYQVSRVAVSTDGIRFEARPEVLGRTYLRVFSWREHTYGLAMPGLFYRAPSGAEGALALGGFEAGPQLFSANMRHNAVLVDGDALFVFWTDVGDTPEHIKLGRIDLRGDWMDWRVTGVREVLRPEHDWEGASAPLEASVRSTAYGVVNQLRDPAIYTEDGVVYLLYAVGGEAGIALARVEFKS